MKAFDRVLTMFGILLLMSFRADAHDPSMAHHEWFNRQEMNPAAQHRLGVPWKSCCITFIYFLFFFFFYIIIFINNNI